MNRHLRALALVAVGFVLGAIAVGGAVAARYVTIGDTEVTSIKLTGGGLPDLGASSTYGVAELAGTIREYHDSGGYEADLVEVDRRAKRSLKNQLRRLRESPGPGRYSECSRSGTRCHAVDPAIVLDIDETSLSNYAGLDASNFARARGVEAFLITGRPDIVREPTDSNLQAARFDSGYTLITKPSGLHTIEYKSGERAKIEEELGFTILVNVGDQDSDLAGGHARRAFKLPNPMYYVP